ncbi:MAG: hypothetical protein ACR2MM_12065 [Flavobacteriaceae bacterium]
MRIKGRINPGHGVASGKSGDLRYPGGTLKHQLPYFKEKGLDLNPYFLGTINLDILPYSYKICTPKLFLEQINWSEFIPPENFYFFDLVLHMKGQHYNGLVYMPDPETKVEHEQGNSILELILPKIHGLVYGDMVEIEIPDSQLKFYNKLA